MTHYYKELIVATCILQKKMRTGTVVYSILFYSTVMLQIPVTIFPTDFIRIFVRTPYKKLLWWYHETIMVSDNTIVPNYYHILLPW